MLQVDSNKTESELGTLDEKKHPVSKYSQQRLEVQRLTEEEIKMYKKCSKESFVKTGLPFAVLCDVVRTIAMKKQGEVKPIEGSPPMAKPLNFRRGLIFLGNVIFGSLFYSPVCYERLREFHNANEKRKSLVQTTGPASFEGSTTKTQLEDFSYPTDLMTNISESESSFSADFNATKFIMEEDEKPKIPQTTYDDLRIRNRERQSQSTVKPSYPIESSSRSSTLPEPILNDPPPPRRVKRNKYGDEME